jgi:hypothetical protein
MTAKPNDVKHMTLNYVSESNIGYRFPQLLTISVHACLNQVYNNDHVFGVISES